MLYEQKYLEKVYLKLNSAQSTKQERSERSCGWTHFLAFMYWAIESCSRLAAYSYYVPVQFCSCSLCVFYMTLPLLVLCHITTSRTMTYHHFLYYVISLLLVLCHITTSRTMSYHYFSYYDISPLLVLCHITTSRTMTYHHFSYYVIALLLVL